MCAALDPFPDPVARTFAKLAANPAVYHAMNGPSEFHVVGSLKTWDITDRLHEITTPTLLVSGRHDEATPLIVGQIHERIPGARVGALRGLEPHAARRRARGVPGRGRDLPAARSTDRAALEGHSRSPDASRSTSDLVQPDPGAPRPCSSRSEIARQVWRVDVAGRDQVLARDQQRLELAAAVVRDSCPRASGRSRPGGCGCRRRSRRRTRPGRGGRGPARSRAGRCKGRPPGRRARIPQP